MELFHQIVLEEYYKAGLIGKEWDSDYVKGKVYERYEEICRLEKRLPLETVD